VTYIYISTNKNNPTTWFQDFGC